MHKYLINRIEALRNKMIRLAAEKGINHLEVLAISQQIDLLHNQYNRMNNPLERNKISRYPQSINFTHIREISPIYAYPSAI